ncbi:cache domain-containing protein [Janthinobacterium sp.]|uniref:cache domain-containing protein n=1 Tax=Janthinobacterium sp. TaxID=1871054 RepID=UPI00293D6F82|nr:cache domain-containing protein [Janthinobacterium sp.]
MSTSLRKMMAGLLLAAPLGCAGAAERSSAADAVALLHKAQDYIREHGVERAVVEFNDLHSPFNSTSPINRHGDLYLYSTDRRGYQAVHGKNPKIRGKIMFEMRDVKGVPLIQELIRQCFATPEGKGWVDYHWPHPLTQKVEAKKGYIERVPGTDFCIGTGIYQ